MIFLSALPLLQTLDPSGHPCIHTNKCLSPVNITQALPFECPASAALPRFIPYRQPYPVSNRCMPSAFGFQQSSETGQNVGPQIQALLE
jgi:hypothetical protein